MSTQIKYAYRRHNTWIYRRTYPVQLHDILGSSLKRSLHTADAKVAAKRVAELNTTFEAIVLEAQAKLADGVQSGEPPQLAIAVPRYQRARLLGEQPVQEVAAVYLAEVSVRLRPGSYKSVRFALELLTSHVGARKLGDLNDTLGKEVLGYIARLSPNIRKYSQAQGASLAELATLSEEHEGISLTAQTQRRIWRQLQQFLDWCVRSGTLEANPWDGLAVKERPEVRSHRVLTDAQVSLLLNTNDRVLHSALLFCLLTGMRSGEACGLLAEDVSTKGNLGRFVQIRPNAVRLLKSKAAEREVPLHPVLETLLDTTLPTSGRLFPNLSVDKVVKRYAYLRRQHPELGSTVFHSTRKWFITQCERTGVPEHFTATLVGHQSARSENKLTYGLYSAGISDTQKREIIDQIRLPQDVLL
ncbi:tyrosine-type recombinase/integrase [Yoonia vestfoldensis]|uniref:Putative integrase n=1 Tax=Yoonia vestfoldensis SKA53 TaxID=314232 RepID=A3V1M6_9RHOB|nr:tyrosine-type recombinase/integrase [Yoonia vestfoldensis]EAQ08226.1 putative integrase [Yoonia vestfoldensis SKA53]EAQ08260.1 putative integrase [Yoonia vestfoldensis SKA53]